MLITGFVDPDSQIKAGFFCNEPWQTTPKQQQPVIQVH